jgi:Ca2+-binding EF-hand superfamily protein
MSSSISSALTSLQTLRSQLFTTSDTDKSGSLSLAEFKKLSEAMTTSGLKSLGKSSQSAEQVFTSLDTNKNGSISLDEVNSGASLNDQITSLMLQLQNIQSGGTMASLISGDSDTDLSSLFNTMSSSTNSLAALLSQSTNSESGTEIINALLKATSSEGASSTSDNQLAGFIQQLLSTYQATESATAESATPTTTTTTTA